MSRKVKLVADKFIADVSGQSFDAIALPVRSLPPLLHVILGMSVEQICVSPLIPMA